MKRAAIVLAFILVLIALCAFMFQRWARATLARLRAENAAECLAETNRIAAAPRRPIFGTPRDADAAAEYLAAFERTDRALTWRDRPALIGAADGPPAPLAGTLSAYVVANRAALEEIRDATRAAQCTWTPFAAREDPRARLSQAAQAAGAMIVLEGHDRLSAGDAAAASRCYLDALALGIDLASDATLLSYLRGIHIVKTAATALARVPCDAAEVEALARSLPSTVTTVRIDRIATQRHFLAAPGDSLSAGFEIATVPLERVLGRGLLALTAAEYDEVLRASEAAYAIDDPIARRARCAEITARAEATWNPFARAFGPVEQLRDGENAARAKLRALVAGARKP